MKKSTNQKEHKPKKAFSFLLILVCAFLVCVVFGFVLFLVFALFGMSLNWNVLFLECALF